ncbi:hypothetical protein B0T25DRAFT_359878 [Lasiosphaeria hispida]|uniref:Uncharacterized protein n=1 Tax=Lasiosphaeria hispida TaxID=260671 RepID=A0AAJ0H7L7_9PEZI|nr:hypothetical protein B0T25DRAFT_359878 [Lasiosphaeria hispida]
MASALFTQLLHGTHIVDDYGARADKFIGMRIEQAASAMEPWPHSDCFLHDTCEFLTRATNLLAQIANDIAHGREIDDYVERRIQIMDESDGFSDIDATLVELDRKHSFVKSIARKLDQISSGSTTEWQQIDPKGTPKPSTNAAEEPSIFDDLVTGVTPLSIDPLSLSPPDQLELPLAGSAPFISLVAAPDPLDETDDEEQLEGNGPGQTQEAITGLIDSLSARGKGRHTCPYGSGCKKGGLEADGSIRLFERNSAFKTHLQKHLRMHLCNLPGCKNTKGFVRIDQLTRHQQTVPHGVVPDLTAPATAGHEVGDFLDAEEQILLMVPPDPDHIW